MSLGSLYGGTPEEEMEIWGKLIGPEQIPTAPGNDLADMEEDSFASRDVQVRQTESDEQCSLPDDIAKAWQSLSEEQRSTFRKLLDDLCGTAP